MISIKAKTVGSDGSCDLVEQLDDREGGKHNYANTWIRGGD